MNKFNLNDLVFHSNKILWGIGKIKKIDKEFVTVHFSEAGSIKIKHTYKNKTWYFITPSKKEFDILDQERINRLKKNNDKRELITLSNLVKTTIKSNNNYRNTQCFSCKSHINTESYKKCLDCGWIVCSCGACGCFY